MGQAIQKLFIAEFAMNKGSFVELAVARWATCAGIGEETTVGWRVSSLHSVGTTVNEPIAKDCALTDNSASPLCTRTGPAARELRILGSGPLIGAVGPFTLGRRW